MSFLILGICLLLLSSGGLVLGLNYAFYMWEEKQIDTLAEKEDEHVHTAEEDMHKEVQKSEEAKQSKRLALPGKRVTSQIQKHMLTTADSEKFVGKLFGKGGELWFNLRTNSLSQAKGLFAYLVSLTKPLEEASLETEPVREEESVESVASPAPRSTLETPGQDTESSASSVPQAKQEDKIFEEANVKPAKIEKPRTEDKEARQKKLEEATLSMVSGAEEKEKAEEMGLFEKLENRILRRLQKSGMSDYDIWLELGDLYVKYNETKKAMEIYALVLKHSVNDIQKEKAMNKLIGL